jgi:hypothetical protein
VIFELAVASHIGLEIEFFVLYFLALATVPWTAHPHCPAHLRGEVEARLRAFPSAFLKEPVSGEVFDNVEFCQERLQSFAFIEGSTIVQKSGNIK